MGLSPLLLKNLQMRFLYIELYQYVVQKLTAPGVFI